MWAAELLLVSVIVILAAAYSVWALLPAGSRRRLTDRLAGVTDKPACLDWLRRAALGLRRRAYAAGGACNDCSAHRPGDEPRR